MPRMRCIDNSNYTDRLTIGNIYDVVTTHTNMCNVIDNNGASTSCFMRRFEPIEAETPTIIEHYTNTNQLSVGMQVRVRTDLEHVFNNEAARNPSYCSPMRDLEGQIITISGFSSSLNYIFVEEDAHQYSWCPEAFEPVEGVVSEVPVDFIVGDIVRVTEDNIITFVRKIEGTLLKLDGVYGRKRASAVQKITEEELTAIPLEALNEVPEYVQQTVAEQSFKKGSRVKLPTRRTQGNAIYDTTTVTYAVEQKLDYMTVANINGTGTVVLSNIGIYGASSFNPSDLEILDTNFVQGAIETGHRVKDSNGRTHNFEAYDAANTNQILVADKAKHIDYIDSTGWFIRVWKDLVTKPRGTMEYTEYMAIAPEDYPLYKAQVESRTAYLEALIENEKIKVRNSQITRMVDEYRQVKIDLQNFLNEERLRIETERIAAENRAKLNEINSFGIWKHHDKSWI